MLLLTFSFLGHIMVLLFQDNAKRQNFRANRKQHISILDGVGGLLPPPPKKRKDADSFIKKEGRIYRLSFVFPIKIFFKIHYEQHIQKMMVALPCQNMRCIW